MPNSLSMTISFLEELEKIAKVKKRHVALGAGAGLALGGAALLMRKPMLRREIGNTLAGMFRKGGRMGKELNAALPKGAVDDAKAVAQMLRAQGIDPSKARIAVSGTGGTGKSTFSKALSQELNMGHIHLDDVAGGIAGRDLVRALNKKPIPKGNIAEQTHLISQVNPDKFDVMVRLHKPMGKVKDQLRKRSRGAVQWEWYDYRKLDKTISTAFHKTEGAVVQVRPGIELKVKPKGGFKADEKLDASLKAMNIDPSGMTRQAKAVTVASGSKQRLPGNLPYIRKGSVGEYAGIPVAGAGAGVSTPFVLDSMDKKAELSKKERIGLGIGGGILGAGLGAAAYLAKRPLTRADYFHRFRSLLKGQSNKAMEATKALPPGAVKDAQQLIKVLESKGIDPKKVNFAISGTPGTGKTTFSTALSQELGIQHVHLDRAGKMLDKHPLMKIKKGPPKGAIYDQTHLLNQVGPDKFDVMIRIHRPMQTVKKQLQQRKRSAQRWDIYDYNLMHEGIRTAFNSTKGAPIDITKNISVKIKPKGGFQADKVLEQELKTLGINSGKLDRQQKVLSVASGKKFKTKGPEPYLRKKEIALGVGLPVGGAAAGAASPSIAESLSS